MLMEICNILTFMLSINVLLYRLKIKKQKFKLGTFNKKESYILKLF